MDSVDSSDTAPSSAEKEGSAESHTRLAVNRITAFSDGVFAIAMTLLIVTIEVPALTGAISQDDLAQALASSAGPFISFAVSFAVVARYWTIHHRQFLHVVRHDGTMLFLNLIFLFFVVVLPIPTEILGKYGDLWLATSIYGLSLSTVTISALCLWWYTARNNRLTEGISDEEFKAAMVAGGSRAAMFLISIPLGLISVYVAYAAWSLSLIAPTVAKRILAIPERHTREEERM